MKMSGRTTRLIDQAIQILFTNGRVTFVDHYMGELPVDSKSANRKASEFAFLTLLSRLAYEHSLTEKTGLRIDKRTLIITLVK